MSQESLANKMHELNDDLYEAIEIIKIWRRGSTTCSGLTNLDNAEKFLERMGE